MSRKLPNWLKKLDKNSTSTENGIDTKGSKADNTYNKSGESDSREPPDFQKEEDELFSDYADLPYIDYKGRVEYYTEFHDIAIACDTLTKWVGEQEQEIVPIAFDMEWPFSFQTGPGKSAVIQLCADISVCFVFHITQLTKLPAALVQLLEHPKVRLHGVNIKNDCRKLESDFKEVNSQVMIDHCRDLGVWCNEVINSSGRWSMARLVIHICKQQINKDRKVRMSKWHIQPLTKEQQIYAAIDVYKLTQDEISSGFSCFGEVEDVRLTKHSYGFVIFRQAESATKALSTEFHTIGEHMIRVAIAKSKLSKKLLKHELTEAKTFLSLNDDCLYKIFSSLDTMDLCSLAVTCSRFKNIAERIFSKTGKLSIVERWDDARLILVTFGSLMSELRIGGRFSNKKNIHLLNLATGCCSDTLKTLILYDIVIPRWLMIKLKPLLKKIKTLHIEYCAIKSVDKEFFASCESLVELKVNRLKSREEEFIIENTYPKLERLVFYPDDDSDLEVFIKRHTNLKSLCLWCHRSVWPTIADDCKQLEEFHIGCECDEVNYIESFKRLSNLDHLRKLNIDLDGQNAQRVTTVLKELKSLKSLQCLELKNAEVDDAGFTPALLQLKRLQVLRLSDCDGLLNFRGLGGLNHVTELTFDSVDSNENIESELVDMIKPLVNLQFLHFKSGNFKLDTQLYMRIADVVRARPFRFQQFLQLTCFATDDFRCEADNYKIIKFKKLTQ